MPHPEIIIIGAGISGLAAACTLAQKGCKVTILEKNPYSGGRVCSIYSNNGFIFEKNPGRIWFPEIIELFFNQFDKKYNNQIKLTSLENVFRVFFNDGKNIDIKADKDSFIDTFCYDDESQKKLASAWINLSESSYKQAITDIKKGELKHLKKIYKRNEYFTKPYSKFVSNLTGNAEQRSLLNYSVFSMGGNPLKSNASMFANYLDLFKNNKYPVTGIQVLINALEKMAYSLGIQIKLNTGIDYFEIIGDKVTSAVVNNNTFHSKYFISSADYCYTDTCLLPAKYSNYSEKCWNNMRFSSSSLSFFVGLSEKIDKLNHFNVFLDTDILKHAHETFDLHMWPENPVFTVKVHSKLYKQVAPEGFENLVISFPVAPGLEDNGKIREIYFNKIIKRLEKNISQKLTDKIIFKKSYAHTDYIHDYNAVKGNILGMENLLFSGKNGLSIKNKKLKNFYYTGHFTLPGPGISFSLLSGINTARHILKEEKLID